MIEGQDQGSSSSTAQAIRDFIASYDTRDPNDRWIAARIRERLVSEQYRREREHMAWIDVGGES